jgi:hypothetical protein
VKVTEKVTPQVMVTVTPLVMAKGCRAQVRVTVMVTALVTVTHLVMVKVMGWGLQ